MLLVIIQMREHDLVPKCIMQFILIIMQVFVKLCEKHVVVARAPYVSICTVQLASKKILTGRVTLQFYVF
jgi:hypothetical protein